LRLIQRAIDTILGAGALVLLSPVLVATAAGILLSSGRPVLFWQRRIGLREREFVLYKFRTMTRERDDAGDLLPDESRLGAFGRFLRSTSLDELPELFNVLRGEMSLVGPRPLLPQYLPRYNEFQRRRHEVKPGITGWAQVNGRNTLTWEQKFELDVWYVDHRSPWLDARILFKTVWLVLARQGISEPGKATMSEFLGSAADGLPKMRTETAATFASSPQEPANPAGIRSTSSPPERGRGRSDAQHEI